MNDTPLPRRLRDITPEWLTQALRATNALDAAARVVAVEPETIGIGLGFVGRCLRLLLTYDRAAAGPPAIVAKMPSTFPPSREIANEAGFYRTETAFYTHLAGRTPIRTPRCYYTAFDGTSDDFLLLLEDLGGLRPQGHDAGCSESDALTAVGALAKMHAAWWGSQELAQASWLPRTDQLLEGMVYRSIDTGWPAFSAWAESRLPPDELSVLARVVAAIPALRDRDRKSPPTLAHGDYRLENFFFDDRAESAGVVALDWQLASYGGGGRDLGYFLGWNLTSEQRRAWEEPLVRCYHDGLAAGGVTSHTFDRCWDDYRMGLLLTSTFMIGNREGMAAAAAFVTTLPSPAREIAAAAMERNIDLQVTMVSRAARAIIETNALEILGA